MRIETLLAHAGGGVDKATGAVAPPIHLSTTFERAADLSYPGGFSYARPDNPTRRELERCLAALEGGVAAAAFSSGSAATMTVLQALSPGDHVLAPEEAYHGTSTLLRDAFLRWGLEADFIDMTDPTVVEAALRPETRLVWIETPSNPLLRITQIRRVADLARAAGAHTVCDNTWATPLLQRPLGLGVDIVMHSTTKYLGGHSDVLGGALITRAEDAFFRRVRELQGIGGAVPSPFDCWLLMRGLQSLACRMRMHCENAAAVAEFLVGHPAVAAVHYPGLPSHPGHEAAARQMSDFGGMLSFQVRGGRERAIAVTGKARLFTRATSLGGVESLIEHRASVEGPHTRTPENLIRLSVGVEHPDDLIDDLAQALEA